jgi:hypothetical protein
LRRETLQAGQQQPAEQPGENGSEIHAAAYARTPGITKQKAAPLWLPKVAGYACQSLGKIVIIQP